VFAADQKCTGPEVTGGRPIVASPHILMCGLEPAGSCLPMPGCTLGPSAGKVLGSRAVELWPAYVLFLLPYHKCTSLVRTAAHMGCDFI